ncbi:MAG TPA: hypothetical protein VGQ99_11395 [Tepidisphaeraceae bacterium]|nr:hypothetical protein [Tepidisphaeraceae bacterium]
MTALLAMLYLALIASLAVGFYASTNSASMVTENEKRTSMALMSCESGMDFMRFHMDQVTIPYGTTQTQLFGKLYSELKLQLEDTGNMGSKTIANDGAFITIPSDPSQYIKLDPKGGEFRVIIENLGQKVEVKIVGRYAGYEARRAVQMKFDLAEKASHIFDYGMASKGAISTAGTSRIRGATDPTKGSILSTSTAANPVSINGKEVSGDISIVNPTGTVTFGGGASIGGSTDPVDIMTNHIHKGISAPEFPAIDTDAFKAYATNPYVGGTNLVNVRIPANSNPHFNSGVNIQGVLYIESPNNIVFNGNVNVQGVIVTQNNPIGNLSTNVLTFSGSVSASPVSTLPESFGDLRMLTGSFLLAQGFQANFTGNFGTINGAIIADKIGFTGNAGGTVMGSIVSLTNNPLVVNGTSEIIIASTGTTDYPAGVFFSSRYAALPDTYEEVKP